MDAELFPYRPEFRLQTFIVRERDAAQWAPVAAIRGAEDCARWARPIYDTLDADREHFLLLALNNKNRVAGFKIISTGSLTAALVHPREVYTAALYFHAAAVLFVHNHPSGEPQPSQEDIALTRRLKECGDIFGIRVLDHIVLGRERFFSFSDRGML